MYILICCLVFAATHLRPDYPTRIVILSERSELRPVHPGRFCGTKGTHVATQPCSLADPLGSPISFLFTFLQTPLWSPKPQPFSFQSILNSLHKTPGVGVPFRLSSPLSWAQNNGSRTTIFLQCRFSFFHFRFSRFPYSLPSTVSRNSCVCHSYEKLPGVYPILPKMETEMRLRRRGKKIRGMLRRKCSRELGRDFHGFKPCVERIEKDAGGEIGSG